jgi:intracellular sulfur oxidation DsrE/DsrF family protein
MITYLFFLVLGMTTVANSHSSDPPHDEKKHKVVMQVSKVDPAAQLKVIGQINNILNALPDTQIQVVCHSEGLPMLVTAQSKVAAHVKSLHERGVVFAACENTMKRNKLTKDDLLPESITVPSGLAEIILKQEAGWTYIKAGI